MAKATPVSCKISCCVVTKPCALACDFLVTLTRSPSTIDGELQAFSHLPFFQTMTDITNRSSMNTQTRIWGQRPPTSAANLAAASSPTPSQEKVPSSPQIRDLERTSCTQNAVRWFLFGSYVPTASTVEKKLLTRNPSTRLTDASSQTWFLSSRRAKTAKGTSQTSLHAHGSFRPVSRKRASFSIKRANWLGGARVPTHFHYFFSNLYQKTAKFLFFPTVPDL